MDSKLHLIHQTTRSFLSNHETGPDLIDSSGVKWKPSVYMSEVHLLLGKICVSQLLLREFKQDHSFFEAKQRNVLKEPDQRRGLTLCFTRAAQRYSWLYMLPKIEIADPAIENGRAHALAHGYLQGMWPSSLF